MSEESFNSISELFQSICKDREVADKQITNAQNSIKPGDKIIRITLGLVIYGEILDPLEEEKPHYDFSEPFDVAEWQRMKHHFEGLWKESYRYGRFYSPRCEEGELGNVHLSVIHMLIPDNDFEAARKTGWPQTAPDFEKISSGQVKWVSLVEKQIEC